MLPQPLYHLLVFSCCLLSHGQASSHSDDDNPEKNTHEKRTHREPDGSFSRRDHYHLGPDGEHDLEFDHEAILGSSEEAEEFDGLAPEEAKRRLALLLEKMDVNGDRLINPSELKEWILKSFETLSLEESTERFDETDSNADNFVTWKEYLIDTFDLGDRLSIFDAEMAKIENDPNRKDDVYLMSEDRIIFKAADVNKDDKLSREEYLSFSHPEEVESVHEALVDEVLKAKDVNEDGKLQFEEYVGDRGEDQDEDWMEEELKHFEDKLDTDFDDELGRDEIIAWIIPNNKEIADGEVEHLFKGADDNNDNILSFEEIIEHHDLFVGSEATNYGEQLNDLEKSHDEL